MTASKSDQYWDSSALVSLILGDSQAPLARRAREAGNRFHTWDWLRIEAHSALCRRGAAAPYFQNLGLYLDSMEFLQLPTESHSEILALLDSHRLRSADAGHLYCLLKARELIPGIEFVCFDMELVAAAKKEGVKIFS